MSLLLLFQNRQQTQPTGGWRRASRRPGHWPREETESERAARILAERIQLGIIEADPEGPPEALSKRAAAALPELRRLARLRAHAEAIADADAALELAGLRAAALLDDEIAVYLRLIEARRLREETEWILLFE